MEGQTNEGPQLNETLYCTLCYFLYSDTRKPASLKNCDHICCEPCIREWTRTRTQTERTCPFCRKTYTEGDIKIERRYLEIAKAYLNTLRLTNEQALRIQVRKRFKELEPSLEKLIKIEKSIIDFYKEAIEKTNSSLWASGGSMIVKSFATGLCFFPGTAPIGLAAMCLTTVTDVGQNLFFTQKKKGVYCQIDQAIIDHDQVLHEKRVKQCFDLYNEMEIIQYLRSFKLADEELASHGNMDIAKWSSTIFHGCASAKGIQSFNVDQVDISKIGPSKTPGGLSTAGKIFLGVGICVEWSLFLYEMRNGNVNKEELLKKIQDTEKTIAMYEVFLRRSKNNEI